MEAINQYELGILDSIQKVFHCSFLDNVFPVFTHICDALVIIIIAVLLIVFKKTRKAGLAAGLSLIIGTLICNAIIKPIVFRTRPYDVNGFSILVSPLKDGSFPSGHSVAAFEVALSVFCTMNKKWGIPALCIAVIASFSRLYLYVHYPSDVLAGMIIGIASGIVSAIIIKKIYEKYSEKSKGFLV